MNSINQEFVAYYQKYKTKGVGIISDCQNVFEIEKKRKFTHFEKSSELTHKMFLSNHFFDNDCLYYFCDGMEIVFYIPFYITYNQYSFFIDLLEKIYQHNEIYKLPIIIHSTGDNPNINFNENTDFSIVKSQLERSRMMIPFIKKEEHIIGEELDEETIRSNIIQMSHLDFIHNSTDLKKSFMTLLKLYHIPYYQKYILSIFPDFSILEGISYLDWKEKEEEINELLKNTSNYQDIYEVFLKGVSYSIQKNIQYHQELSHRYESFQDNQYQKEILQNKKTIENEQLIYQRICNRNILSSVHDDNVFNQEENPINIR